MASSQVITACADDEDIEIDNFTILIFGGGGDLSRKKLFPTLLDLYKRGLLPEEFSIVAAGSPQDTSEPAFHEIVRTALKENAKNDYNDEIFARFIKHVSFLSLRFENDEAFAKLKELVRSKAPRRADGKINIVYYLSIPPLAFTSAITQIGKFAMNRDEFVPKLIIEKPFGTDGASARKLNDDLHSVFKEKEIYRIDHYLGKETVQNILFFRFLNSMFEPLWNNKYIDHIQITVAEDIGIESRGKFYESSGVVRDIIQNHALQLVSMMAMEPPVSFEDDAIRDERAKVFRSMPVWSKKEILENTVYGQYDRGIVGGQEVKAYREEALVDPQSKVPTFFAAKFMIDNWRWAGVPFYVRAGKRLGKRLTDIVIVFKQVPHKLFGACQNSDPNIMRFDLQPKEAITISYDVKYPNTIKSSWPVTSTFTYDEHFDVKSLPAYARLILDCLKGDLTLFVREDNIELNWDLIDPIINLHSNETHAELPNYKAGSSGPKAADELLARDGRKWFTPLK